MKFARRLYEEQKKNLLILFRNPSSILLLIIGPLVLILLIGFTYSSDDVHGIRIGVLDDQGLLSVDAIGNLSNYAEMYSYSSVKDCIIAMEDQYIHICLELEQQESIYTIRYYFDNSRKELSKRLGDSISDYFGIESDLIGIEAAEEIFGSIEDLIVYLRGSLDDIDSLLIESSRIREDLDDRHSLLLALKSEFDPPYVRAKGLHVKILNLSHDNNETYAEVRNSLMKLDVALDDLSIYISNITNITSDISIINATQKEIQSFLNVSDNLMQRLDHQIEELDRIMLLLDQIELLLDQEINSTEGYMQSIDDSVFRVETVKLDLNSSITALSWIGPGLAEQIIRPMIQKYEPILPGLSNLSSAFPSLLALIVVFISLLFSTIVAISELDASAFRRNRLSSSFRFHLISGLLVTIMGVVLLQVSVLLIVAQLQFNVDVLSVLAPLLGVVFLLSLFFICLGITLAIMIKNPQAAVLTSTFTALSIFLFSNAIAALEIMPKVAASIAAWSPFVIASSAFKSIVIFQNFLIFDQVMLLIGYCMLSISILIYAGRRLG